MIINISLEKNLDKIYWSNLSSNENAIHLLENNLNRIDWYYLSENKNAIHILEKNLDKVDWNILSSNENAIHILENNLDKVDWYELSRNINIFDYDYDKMKEKTSVFKEELIAKVFHPTRFIRYLELGYDMNDSL